MLDILVSKKSIDLVQKGFPWVYKSDILNFNSRLKLAEPGEAVRILNDKGRFVGVGFINPNNSICCRVLSLKNEKIDKDFFKNKFERALERRFKHFDDGFFRLVFGESDGLPGLIIDLYGEYAVAQVNAGGMDKLMGEWLQALVELLNLKGVYLDASSKQRTREGLDDRSKIIFGEVAKIIEVRENGISYFADIIEGQKTGWFYDHRENRKFLANKALGKSFLDLYTHSGGFGLLAAAHGAKYIELVDRSELSLHLAEESYTLPYFNERYQMELKKIKKNSASTVTQNIKFIKAEAFDYLNEALEQGKKFDIVNADPPAFIKNKKDVEAGIRGYEKLVKRCMNLVDEDGIFAISSCSYFARPDMFKKLVERAMESSGRSFELIRKSGADKDHPVHPLLGETNYLKFLAYKLD